MERVETSSAESPAPYLHAQRIADIFPEVLSDVDTWPVYLKPNWMQRPLKPTGLHDRLRGHTSTEIFIGGHSARFPYLHFDDYHYHAFVGQVYGRKKFFMYPPDDSPRLYPTPGRAHVSQIGDVEHPDLERFPLFAHARPQTCAIEAGDLLFVPSGWWHTTRMVGTSISVATNVVNASNWRLFAVDILEEMAAFHPRWQRSLYAAYLKWQGGLQSLKDRFRSPR